MEHTTREHISGAAPISKDNTPRSFAALFNKFRQRPLREQWSLLRKLLRGYLSARAFDEAIWPLMERGARISKQNGWISVGRFVTFAGNCQIAVAGKGDRIARLSIGEFSSIGPSTVINVAERLEIGSRCLISWNCDIMDTDFHEILISDGEARQPVSKPVKIGNDVWIGARCMILKGVTIGDSSVIGAGSVVINDIPPYSLAAGNPARVIRPIAGWRR